MRRLFAAAVVGAAFLATAATASGGHGIEEYDHPSTGFAPTVPPSPTFQSGGTGATWDLVATIPTGNPHTDLDFFTQNGETYASAGTLGTGGNDAGQTIVRLTQNGLVNPLSPQFVEGHPSANCLSNPIETLSLQHDVEATPKGHVPLNTTYSFSSKGDAQLLIDATDAPGRCHDNGTLGLTGVPQGGLEIIDITDIGHPVEIGLVSHIGEAHTVNVDPKRPHIAYAVTSDAVGVRKNADGSFTRLNEVAGSSDRLDLDGFEVVDLSTCMNFPIGTTIEQKRAACRPTVYRYRYPTAQMALGHTSQTAVSGCHELEVYPDDRLTCGSGNAAIVLDLRGSFDSRGRPRGTPLPCEVRPSTSAAPYDTGAMVTDCVVGQNGQNLDVPSWLAAGAPSLGGVRYVGSAHHMGRGAGGTITTYDSTQDVDFDHELELTASRRFVLATDERGGGVAPPGATCASVTDNKQGNGGIHAYAVSRLDTTLPATAAEAWDAYAKTPSGAKAIYRALPRTGVEPSVCTAHVFHQIPGQNRIFMGWYSQGTQVVDFVERNGTFEFREAGWFIPANANTWTSAVFKVQRNGDGSYTYWGATGDFFIDGTGRSAIDVYKVTLPPPPR
jgi:hypothetical protein